MSKLPLCALASFPSTFHLQVQQPFVQHHENEDLHVVFCHIFTKPLILQTYCLQLQVPMSPCC
jgi:hypothetical protein